MNFSGFHYFRWNFEEYYEKKFLEIWKDYQILAQALFLSAKLCIKKMRSVVPAPQLAHAGLLVAML
jgi:uncharacterized membrane protein